MSCFSLDIGSNSIKMIALENNDGKFRLSKYGLTKTPGLGLMSDKQSDLVAVAEAIKKLRNELKINTNEVYLSLPERSVFSQIIEMPKMSNDELQQAIPWEAEDLIPQPLNEVRLDWEVLEENNSTGKLNVLLIAAPNTVIARYLDVLRLAELKPVLMETEVLSLSRCLNANSLKGSFLVLNIGAKAADLSITKAGNVYLTRSLAGGGDAMTRALSSSLGLELVTAEEYKKTYGLTNQLEGKVALSLEPVVSIIINETKKAMRFYQEKNEEPLKALIMTGGTSLLPGLPEYLTKALNLEVVVMNPFSFLTIDQQTAGVLKNSSPLYSVALGLSLKTNP